MRLDRSHWRALFLAVGLAALAPASACKKNGPAVVESKPDAEVPETPVPAPEGIVAEGVVKSPDAMLASLRSISLLIPDKAGGLFADVLHVPKDAAREIDGSKPVCFVVIKRAEATSFALSVAIKDPSKVNAALQAGAFKRSEDADLGAAVYEGTAKPRSQIVAVRRNFLIAASSPEALKALAPYVTRTMPQRPPLADDVVVSIPQAAMRGPALELWKSTLESAVQRRKDAFARAKTSGTAGAAGAPVSAMELLSEWLVKQNQRSLKWLGDAGDARIALTTDKGAIKLRAEVAVPDASSGFGKTIAGWSTQDATSILKLPTSSVAAFSMSESATDRATSSTDVVELLSGAYPKDLPKDAREKMLKFLSAWDAARGDFTSGAIVYEDLAHVGVVLRLGAKDPKAASAMLKEALASVLAIKGVSDELTAADIAAPSFSTATIPGPAGGAGIEVNVLSIPMPRKKTEPPKPGGPESADVVWGPAPGGGDVLVVIGTGAREVFAHVLDGLSGGADKALGASGELATQVKALGPGLAAALVVFPGRVVPLVKGSLMAAPPAPTDGVAFTVGRTPTGAFLTLDLAKPAVETLARLAFMSSLR
jgi:hypothetical protein